MSAQDTLFLPHNFSSLPEGRQRELLAEKLLSPLSRAAFDRYKQVLFRLENRCILHNCETFCTSGATPQPYMVNLDTFCEEFLQAAVLYTAAHYDMTYRIRHNTYAAVYPRYLQWALLHILKENMRESRCLHLEINAAGCYIAAPRIRNPISIAVAKLHGGTVLRTCTTDYLCFTPKTEETAYPVWLSTGVDGLLQDKLSPIQFL